LQGVDVAALEATQTARNIVRLREHHRAIIIDELGSSASAALKLLEYLFERPVTTVGAASEVMGRQFPNGNRIVTKLCELGILRETTHQARNRVFMYADYFMMFDETAQRKGRDIERQDPSSTGDTEATMTH
jgi:hypothetical protein